MREQYKQILKSFFCEKVLYQRNAMEISQEEMAYRLSMAVRTYVDIEHGRTCCSALTLVLFLVYLCDTPIVFLEELKDAFEGNNKKTA